MNEREAAASPRRETQFADSNDGADILSPDAAPLYARQPDDDRPETEAELTVAPDLPSSLGELTDGLTRSVEDGGLLSYALAERLGALGQCDRCGRPIIQVPALAAALAEQYGVTVLRGAELETDIGHVLVYGISPELAKRFDFTSVSLPHRELFEVARATGGFAVGAHAGRPRIGLAHYVHEHGLTPDGIEVVEQLNGGSSSEENERALALAEEYGFRCVGGSDAHFVSAIGRCLTAFRRPVTSIEVLVEELAGGDFFPVTVEQTQRVDAG